jgi:hypothetical protein
MTTKGNMVWGQQKGAGEQEWVLREDDWNMLMHVLGDSTMNPPSTVWKMGEGNIFKVHCMVCNYHNETLHINTC